VAAIKTILCIEDDLFIGEMYARSLRKAGYEVELMTNGEEGLNAALNKHYGATKTAYRIRAS
jgi:DNA-binding response OmpR family regulator